MDRNEELLRGRVYGADHDHPGPLPHRDYAELVGGPLDGLLLDITGWTVDEIQTGVALMTELGQCGLAAAPSTTRAPASGAAGIGPETRPEASPGVPVGGSVGGPIRRRRCWVAVHKISDAFRAVRVCLSVIHRAW
ncbi:hypothetical protein GCM10010336_51380 [Streptomyces goshikiensis]|nr:hypothetical protein GCM10010336_51380 [Streptomyces goshikiensis]